MSDDGAHHAFQEAVRSAGRGPLGIELTDNQVRATSSVVVALFDRHGYRTLSGAALEEEKLLEPARP